MRPASLPAFALSFNAMFTQKYAANGGSDYVHSQLYEEVCELLRKNLEPASYRLMLFAEVRYSEKSKKYIGVLRKKGHGIAYYDFDEFRKMLGERGYELVCYTYLISGVIEIVSQIEIDYSKLHLMTDSQELADGLVAEQGVLTSNIYLLQASRVALSDMNRLETLIQESRSSGAEIYLDVDATLVHGAESTAFMTEQLIRIYELCKEKFSSLRFKIITARSDDSHYLSTQTFMTVRDVCLELMSLTGLDVSPSDIIFTSGRFDKGEFVEEGPEFRLFFDDQKACLESMAKKVNFAVQVHPLGFTTEAWDRLSRNLVPSAMELSSSRHSVFSASTATPTATPEEDDNFVDLGGGVGPGLAVAPQRTFTFYSGPKK